jgi:predicted O-methyltransferase YrrM
MARYGITNVDSYQTTEIPENETFDLVFIDAGHDYENVSKDIERATAILDENGLLAFHDYRSLQDPGVTKAVDELLALGGELISTTDSLAVVRPPAAVLMEI